MFRILAALFLFSPLVYAQNTVEANRSNNSEKISEYSSFVVQAILEDMGLSLDDVTKKDKVDNKKKPVDPDKIIPKPKPIPKPDPQPVPEPIIPPKPDPEPEPQPEPEPEPQPEPVKKPKAADRFAKMRNRFKQRYDNILDRWKERYQEIRGEWKKANEQYQKEEDAFVAQTYDLSSFAEESANLQSLGSTRITTEDILANMSAGDFHVLPNALDLPIRDQQRRGTCAAFTGIRAIETLIIQNDVNRGKSVDLSEQHFYWMSRPECMEKPCTMGNSSDGSNFDVGFRVSAKVDQPVFGIFGEQACQYIPNRDSQNLTYTPLNGCRISEQARIADFDPNLTMDDLLPRLYQNQPIAAGFKLTNSYKKTKGVVRLVDPANRTQATGEHVPGHAMLLVGYIKLPDAMHAKEGRFCAIMANSWGLGFGAGGYACLTEKWMDDNRFSNGKQSKPSMFTALKSITVR